MVQINPSALGRAMATRGIPSGICADCQDEQERKERQRWKRRR
jgi:hypothetical protein